MHFCRRHRWSCRCYRRATNLCRSGVFQDIIMVLYKYLHVVFMLPIYSHDFSISFNQAIFEREKKRDFVMITCTVIFFVIVVFTSAENVFFLNFFASRTLFFCKWFFFHAYRILYVSFSSICLKVLFFLVASVMLRDALNSNEHQFVFMCLSMALLRHSQFFSETSSLFCIFFSLFAYTLVLTKSNSSTRTATATKNRVENIWYDGKNEEQSKCYCFT